MVDRAPLPPINFAALADALLARAHSLLPQWLPGGVERNGEWVCGDLSGGKGDSCSVNIRTGKWADFGGDESDRGGDLVSLYAAIHGLDMGKAAVAVARDEGLEDVAGVQRSAAHVAPVRPPAPPAVAKPPVSDEEWRTVRPVPANAPEPTFRHHHRQPADIMHTSAYRVGDDVHGYVVRFRDSKGGKEDVPYTWCQSLKDGTLAWKWKQFQEPRPLYLPAGQLPKPGQTVVLVEGEIKGDVLQALLNSGAPGVYTVASWPGGCKAWAKADWSWLAGCTVLAWPDTDSKRVPLTAKERNACADDAARAEAAAAKPYMPAHKQPGLSAMLNIGAHLRDAHGCDFKLLAIEAPGVKPDGWDAKDAITTDGWGFDDVMRFFATAYALPAAEGAAPAAAVPVEKKRETPADADDDGQSGGGGGRGPHWLQAFWNKRKQYWMVSRELVIAALENDMNLVGLFAVNKLTNNIDLRRPLPGSNVPAGPMTGATDLLLGRYLSVTYGVPSISRAALSEAIETVSHHNEFHPVREYLEGLHAANVWDGTKRLDKWLAWVIGEIEPKTGKPLVSDAVFEYLGLVGRYFLLGMVNRVMNPGCKFDYCMVLEGKGGLMKSTLFKTLASKQWFSDTHFDVGRGKDGQEQVQGLWVYEIAELAAFSKSDINLIKAFISAEVDRYRPSYGRVVEAYPRQCVLGGTTNERQWMRDRTGNRRMWPVAVRNQIKIDWLAKFRDQLMAEAFTLYLEGTRFFPLPAEEDRLFVPMQEARLVESTVMSALLEVLTRESTPTGIGAVVHKGTEFVTMKQLNEALHVDAGKSSAALDSQIRAWLDSEGWEYCKKQVNGVRAHGYKRPRDWPKQEPDTEQATVTAPAAVAAAPVSAAGAFLASMDDDAPF